MLSRYFVLPAPFGVPDDAKSPYFITIGGNFILD
jgi:hypothetical protein